MNYIIPVITGAIIGYFTNWLAIKMLFRPLREKRLLGIRVPFTPGLIPKERKRIAKSVGNTIGQHLLSPQVLSQSLCSPRIISYIKESVREGFKRLEGSALTIGDYIQRLPEESFYQVDMSLKSCISQSLTNYLEDRENRKRIINVIGDYLHKGYHNEENKEYSSLRQFTGKSIREYTEGQEFKDFLSSIIKKAMEGTEKSDRTIGQVLPQEVFDGIGEYIYEHEDKLALVIRNGVSTAPVREKLKNAIISMLEQNLGRIVTMFASLDSISEKIIKGVEEYLSNPENHREIADMTISFIGNLTEVKISSLSSGIMQKGEDSFGMLSEAAITALWESENAKKTTSPEGSGRIPQGLEELLVNLSEGLTEYGYIRKVCDAITHKSLSLLWSLKVSSFSLILEPGIINSLSSGVESIYIKLVESKAPQVVENMNIPCIVEDEINGFDIEFTEKLITDIAKKELSAITWLGALLGAVMGIVIPVLQNIL